MARASDLAPELLSLRPRRLDSHRTLAPFRCDFIRGLHHFSGGAAANGDRVLLLYERAKVAVILHEQHLEVAVVDRGHGIAEPERLFEPFFSTKAQGLGMGLNICRTIIESHHGRLWADPNPAGGTIFRFTLPCATPDQRAQSDQPEELHA